ncbi:SNF2-related protein, partial [Deferribacter abyssi]|uniref:SNF2-related protein n=1 Tax=Deferribacter abyssi TaxID=213806 RepID=UPI003C216142
MSELETKKLLSPEIVSEYIAFNAADKNYTYDENDKSMFAKQYEGVAYLWNLLETKNIALLADEVGTGKTYQALGVLITLLKIKPDARCLIIAPRYQVAMNWIREYYNFISIHYKLLDDQIKSSITHSAIPTI